MTQKELHQRILEAEKAGAEASALGEDVGTTNVGSAFGGFWDAGNSIDDFGSRIANAWDRFKNGATNTTNKEIADENLAYEKERAEVEDERYLDETAYNRAWAEEERAYNRALQQTLFDREDTAISRQASQLASLGINPASQNLQGLNAGSQVTSATEPTTSSRIANTPSNQFKMQDSGMLPILSSMLSLASTINGVKTGEYQRDALALQNDKQFLENLSRANELGINYNGYFHADSNKHYTKNGLYFSNDNTPLFDTPEFKSASYSAYRKQRMDSMPSWQYTLDSLGQDDVYKQAESALTRGANLFDKVFDKNENIKNFNPFTKLLNLFW